MSTDFSSNKREYFDLHTNGIGYVNRIREVFPQKGRHGKPSLHCTIAALRGAVDSPAYTYYDVIVTGSKAQELIRMVDQPEKAGQKVLVGFRIGDGDPGSFTYERGAKEGEEAYFIRGRLLFLSWIKVDGEEIFRAPPRQSRPPVAENSVASAAAA